MSTIKIKPALLQAFIELKEEQFTVAELTQCYLSQRECGHKDKKSARQFVYRNMQRMMEVKCMRKLNVDGGWPRYEISEKFQLTATSVAGECQPSSDTRKTSQKDVNIDSTDYPAKLLRERLSRHRSDMLCALGEAEEYETLCHDIPELCQEAQALYNDARERSTLLLGKIKALECILSSHS